MSGFYLLRLFFCSAHWDNFERHQKVWKRDQQTTSVWTYAFM